MKKFLLLICMLSSACSTTVIGESHWVDPSIKIVPTEQNRVEDSRMVIPNSAELVNLLRLLDSAPVIKLNAQQLANEVPRLSGMEGDFYVVRAVKDSSAGVYSAFQEGESIVVLYSHFGECGKLERSAILVRADGRNLTRVYGGCSGAR
ncbi:hypothetical protein [Marilutibacter chinensis]|uniref:Lipoprotein n=1 Tax=Marilutibacter chinensis TaxID=2912247 RepID=A0ABS9HW22_9GAMM|nr:hypothetical protein [Lysobacter chinensis]MCF7223104.1 hypothetical protein [Lysobacter chinensis]